MKIFLALFGMIVLVLGVTSNCFATTSSAYIVAHAIRSDGRSIPPQLIDNLKRKRLVMLGEIHGTNEMPDFTFQIVAALAKRRKITLGLEFPSDLQPLIDAFLVSGDIEPVKHSNFFQDRNYGSGRTTGAIIALLDNVRRLKNVKILCFDIPFKSKLEPRDTLMAENVISYQGTHPDRELVTLSGNYHSRLDHEFMGAEIMRLSKRKLNIVNSTDIYIRASEGTAWNCLSNSDGQIDCGPHGFGPSINPYSVATEYLAYVLEEPRLTDGHKLTFFIRHVSAAVPL